MSQEKSTNFIKDIVLPIVIALIIAVLLRHFVIEMYFVPSGSMIPTLQLNDHVVVTKFSYKLGEPERGDIIVFKYPPNEEQGLKEIFYVKRLIGLPGEKLEVKNNQVFINDEAIDEPYLNEGTNMPDYGPITVPADSYFAMGDNRNHSSDSRIWGYVPEHDLVGKAQIIYWPLNRMGGLN